MINGMHAILYSTDADADRAFLLDVLGFPNVDAGGGWLIFQLPPSELGVYPTEESPTNDLYFLCDDLDKTLAELAAKDVRPVGERIQTRWGARVRIRLPSRATITLYEPRYPVAQKV